MCDTVISFACDQLLSLARDHLLPLLKEVTNMIRGVPKEVADMKNELESIEDFINNADRLTEAEEDNTRDGIKAKIRQLREASFHIQDVIDEYMIGEGQQPHDPGCAALLPVTKDFFKTRILHLQIAYKIQDIKSLVSAMDDTGGKNHGFLQIKSSLTRGSSSSAANENTILNNLREAPFYIGEAQVVGFEAPRDELVNLLIDGRKELTVVSVVGMGGQGKTTLAKQVFDSKEVIGYFDCRVWITVSRHTVEGLLRDMLQNIYKQTEEDLPCRISEMDRRSLIDNMRNFLQNKRYIIFFDEVWNEQFWNDIGFSLIDSKKGSRVLITTRKIDVAMSCKRSSFFLEVHELKPLSHEKSLELFYKKAFFDLNDLNGPCPKNLMNVSSKIVEKCEGLPLAIVAIGGLLSTKERYSHQWERFSENLSSELDNNPSIHVITKILGFSFHDLPYNLKQCFLYFGIFPGNYEVNTMKLIKQWVAEGFVKEETGKTVEEIAEQYLTELIHRRLVLVSSFSSNSKARSCHVRGLIREMILDKIQDLSFCNFTQDNEDQSVLSLMTRRLTISTSSNTLLSRNVECSNIRSLHVFKNEELPDSFVASIPSKFKLLKVFDFEDVALHHYVPKNLGDLFHLRYLSFRNTKVRDLPGSIGKLHNLETLDLRQTMVRKLPKEINKLQKLRHLLAYDMSKGVGYGIQLNDGIGDIASLQMLREVQADHGGVELITDLERLKQLKMLGLTNVKQEYTEAVCSSINEMQHLEKLYIAAKDKDEVIDFSNFDVSLHKLQKLRLVGKLERFPYWIRELQNLVKLSLSYSMLTHDPLKSLKDLPNLLCLSILFCAYEGEHLHFQDEGFKSLKQLVLRRLYNLKSIKIGKGALSSLEKFKLVNIPQLMEVPSGVYNLPRLVCHIINMTDEFEQSIDRVRGQHRWIIEKVPCVGIVDRSWAPENV